MTNSFLLFIGIKFYFVFYLSIYLLILIKIYFIIVIFPNINVFKYINNLTTYSSLIN